jgi:vancomycin resistance protein YoaR
MPDKHTQHLTLCFIALLTVAVSATLELPTRERGGNVPYFMQGKTLIGSSLYLSKLDRVDVPDTPLSRVAQRLQARIRQWKNISPPFFRLVEALEERKILLSKRVSVTLVAEDETTLDPWLVSFHRYPTWLKAEITATSAEFSIDSAAIRAYLEKYEIDQLPRPTDARLAAVTEDKELLRATVDRIAMAGYTFDVDEAVNLLTRSFSEEVSEASLHVWRTAGTIINKTSAELGTLQLLASGQSNFAGSDGGRIANVRKGLQDHLNNVLVPPGSMFSFNSTLGPVTLSAGWREALGIFNMGAELRPVPGGGVCQVATTVYRAIVNAGFPVIDRRNHSLFVKYYEQYGVGIDATIFPPSVDLTFVNDTPSHLLIQAYYDGFDAFVNIYGTPDGRTVTLEGPYFATNAPEGLLVNERQLKKNEIVWLQRIQYTNGSELMNIIVSRYKDVPKNIIAKYGAASET